MRAVFFSTLSVLILALTDGIQARITPYQRKFEDFAAGKQSRDYANYAERPSSASNRYRDYADNAEPPPYPHIQAAGYNDKMYNANSHPLAEHIDENGYISFGDMLIRPDQLAKVTRYSVNGDNEEMATAEEWMTDKTKKWPNGRVPYEKDSSLSEAQKKSVDAAVKKYSDAFPSSCVEWVAKTASDNDYVSFKAGTNCESPLGVQGGKQNILLTAGCDDTMVAMHEMMHALGRAHEHQRFDRDSYVTINYDNINGGRTNTAFDIFSRWDYNDQGYPYDIKSIMHYPSWAHAKSGKVAMEPIDKVATPTADMGAQHPDGDFSYWDQRQLRTFYGCPDH